MSDAVSYVLVVGAIVLPAYAGVLLCNFMLKTVYENQAAILSLPFF